MGLRPGNFAAPALRANGRLETGTPQLPRNADANVRRPLGEAGNFTKYYYPEPDLIKVFLKGGSSLVINTRTKDAVYEGVKRRPLISSMVQLHFNPGKWWTWFADAFAVCLIIITVSGIVMIKGPKGLWGRGGIELVAGILIPILFLACF